MRGGRLFYTTKSYLKAGVKSTYREMHRFPLTIDNSVKPSILIQSLHGRIIAGHIPHLRDLSGISFEEVCDQLDISSHKIKQKRQELTNGMRQCIDTLLDGNPDCLINKEGFPVYGIQFLKRYRIKDTKVALQGAVILGLHDSEEWRQKTMNHYKSVLNKKREISIGYGKEFLISRQRLSMNDLTVHRLENDEHTRSEIEDFRKKEIIVDNIEEGITAQYIRLKKDLGICDDASVLTAGKIYGPDASLMGFLMDTTDTYQTHITQPVEGGIDQQLAQHIQETWRTKHNEELVSPEEIMRVIYLSAKNNSQLIPFSSSHRRFIERPTSRETKDFSYQSTIENHLRFLKTGFQFPCRLGFQRYPSLRFYKALEKRWQKYEKRFNVTL